MARIRLAAGQMEPAETLLRRALELEPHFPAAPRLLAEVLEGGGQQGEARTVLQHALRFTPGEETLREALARLIKGRNSMN